MMMRLFIASISLLLCAGGARAIIGGREDAGTLSRSSIMIVSQSGMCSAVVVAPRILLTAGHCVAGNREYRVHYRDASGEPVLIAPAAKAVHPGYRANAAENRKRSIDLALVRVAERLPSRFAPATLSASQPRAGAAITIGGYGLVGTDARSAGTFRTVSVPVVEPYGPGKLLVWAEGRGEGACQGDSGGPMEVAGMVVAITGWSSTDRAKGCGGMTQGVLVGSQRNWIDRTTAGWGGSVGWEGGE
jgi:hypothetical protein